MRALGLHSSRHPCFPFLRGRPALSSEGSQHCYILPRTRATSAATSCISFSNCFVSSNTQFGVAELHFHVVNPGSELLITIYKIPQKPVWTITELNKQIKKWNSNNEAVWNTPKHEEHSSIKSRVGAIPQFRAQHSFERWLASVNTTHPFQGAMSCFSSSVSRHISIKETIYPKHTPPPIKLLPTVSSFLTV